MDGETRRRRGKIGRIFAVPHFHYDVEWWKTEDGYNRDVEQILLKALELLEENQEFRYVIDQALALKPFWDKHPEAREEIRAFVREGRVELVGGTWCAPDENIPTGEAFVRQFVHGRRFFEETVGGTVSTAWEIDEFGHPAQVPQLLVKSGFRHFAFARGVQNWREDHPLDFLWEGPDGSRILTHWFAAHYTGLMPLPGPGLSRRAFRREVKSRLEYEGRRTLLSALMLPFGTDFTVPSQEWIDFVGGWNRDEAPRITFSLPREFFDAAREEASGRIPVVRGEFNPVLTGCYESRVKVKQLCRASQYALTAAEKWASIAWRLGEFEYPEEKFDRAWELVLQNDFHDVVCGTGTDRVYRNTLKRYGEAMETIERETAGAFDAISRAVDTDGPGVPLIVFNPLNFERTDLVKVDLSILTGWGGGGGDEPPAVRDAGGNAVASQVEGKKLIFTARVPSVGYSTYFVSRDAGSVRNAPGRFRFEDAAVENDVYRLEMDARTGGIRRLLDREDGGRDVLDASRWKGNELFVEEDAGNLWTIQKTGRTWRAGDYRAAVRPLKGGPVRCGFETRGKLAGMFRVQRVYIYNDLRRIDFETWLDFHDKDKRVKAVFESAAGGKVSFETPFYTQERGDGHWCAQNWVDVGNDDRGAALINTGTPGHDVEGAALAMTLMRSVSVLSPAFLRFVLRNLPGILKSASEAAGILRRGLGMYEWAMYDYHGLTLREWSSRGGPERAGGLTVLDHLAPWLTFYRKSDAWERGMHHFTYALLPRRGSLSSSGVVEAGLELNNPLTAFPAARHGGTLPPSFSFLRTECPGGILTTLKKAGRGNSLVARLYESRGAPAPLTLTFFREIGNARKVNLVETDVMGAPAADGCRLADALAPWEIATYTFDAT
ncbi:MAG: glycoside hydrolase family 38 C-terminal domain-containing protein [bacterium]